MTHATSEEAMQRQQESIGRATHAALIAFTSDLMRHVQITGASFEVNYHRGLTPVAMLVLAAQ